MDARHPPTSVKGSSAWFPVALGLAFMLMAPVDAHSQDESAHIATAAELDARAGDLRDAIEELREATARFGDMEVALAEGYVRDPMNLCVSASTEGFPSQLGGMGVHFFRPDLLGLTATEPRVAGTGTYTDFSRPGVLVYFPAEDGELRLGAVENLVFKQAWHDRGRSDPPAFHGHQYWTMVDNPDTPDVDEAHMFEPHYELHLWIHEENPLGVAHPFNPGVSCANHDGPKTVEEGIEWAKAHGS